MFSFIYHPIPLLLAHELKIYLLAQTDPKLVLQGLLKTCQNPVTISTSKQNYLGVITVAPRSEGVSTEPPRLWRRAAAAFPYANLLNFAKLKIYQKTSIWRMN